MIVYKVSFTGLFPHEYQKCCVLVPKMLCIGTTKMLYNLCEKRPVKEVCLLACFLILYRSHLQVSFADLFIFGKSLLQVSFTGLFSHKHAHLPLLPPLAVVREALRSRRFWSAARHSVSFPEFCCLLPWLFCRFCLRVRALPPVGNMSTHCNTLQHTCNTWNHTAAHCSTLQHTATHCNTLQHTATHCNTLQHVLFASLSIATCWRSAAISASFCWVCSHFAYVCTYVSRSYAWHESFICATWLIAMCNLAYLHVQHDTFTCSHVRHDSFISLPHPTPPLSLDRSLAVSLYVYMWVRMYACVFVGVCTLACKHVCICRYIQIRTYRERCTHI